MLLIFLNATLWLTWGIATGSAALIIIESIFALGALGILFGRNRIPGSLPAHMSCWIAFLYIASIVLCFEGTTPESNPVDHLWLLVLASAGWLTLRDEDRRYAHYYAIVCFLAFLVVEFSVMSIPAFFPQPAENHGFAQSVSKVSQFLTIMAITYVYTREITDAESHLGIANERLENLLANMLPASIARRLRAEGKTFADGYASCTVLFADLVGFTPMSASMAPLELVKLLDELFSEFDSLTDELGLEKIKTIGDAYMVAAGLPQPREDHATAAVELALRLRTTVEKYSDLNIRIGINSGEVVAGIIGRKRFIYDLWGDTVNIASRMESHGLVDGIQISASTYAAVQGQFDCELRGEIEIKGRGRMKVYMVRGRKDEHTTNVS